jgi:galactokinase
MVQVERARYIYEAQRNFYEMMNAWSAGDVVTLGALFRRDGHGLRDLYRISGPELESICDSVRTIEGVYGERMLGGGDKGASGALVAATSVDKVRQAVATGYTRSHPSYADKYAVHVCKIVDGIKVLDGLLI